MTKSPTATEASLVPEYEFHPLANIFPMLESKELNELLCDIEANGLNEPITLYEGKILDGRNRYKAAQLGKITLPETAFRQLPDGIDAEKFVISANIHRRHLTAEQKRDLIAKLIKANPTQSNRLIAEQTKTSHHTVVDVRETMEGTGQIAQLSATTGKDGKTRKTKVKGEKKAKSKPQKDEEPKRDLTKYKAFLGTVLDALAKWPRDAEQAKEWNDYTLECLERVMDETWLYPEDDEEAEAGGEQPPAQLQ